MRGPPSSLFTASFRILHPDLVCPCASDLMHVNWSEGLSVAIFVVVVVVVY